MGFPSVWAPTHHFAVLVSGITPERYLLIEIGEYYNIMVIYANEKPALVARVNFR
jgi:hypothetical protein